MNLLVHAIWFVFIFQQPVTKVRIIQTDGSYLIADIAKKALEDTYNVSVTVESGKLPASAYYRPRNRYKASIILDHFDKLNTIKSQEYIMIITSKDLSTSRMNVEDWGIMGMSKCPGPVSVASTFRSGENFKKVVIHEFAHGLGVRHCDKDATCIMTDLKGTGSIANKSSFCKSCKNQLNKNLKK